MTRNDEVGERMHPRDLLIEPERFGQDQHAQWHQIGRTPLGYVVSAYWQHRTVCAVRAKFPDRPEREVAERLGRNLRYLTRQFRGDLRVSIEELCVWAIAFEDVALLPRFSSPAELLPPGSRPADHGEPRSDEVR